jgi:hypothetical protein
MQPHVILTVATGGLLAAAARTELGLGLFQAARFLGNGSAGDLGRRGLEVQDVQGARGDRSPRAEQSHHGGYDRNMYEDRYMGSAEFASYMHKRAELREFLTAVGAIQKP